MGKKLGILSIFLLLFNFSFASDLEDRVKKLEEKVKQLEERLNKLEKNNTNLGNNTSNTTKTVKPPNPVDFVVISKRFKEAELGESLWNRDDKIELKVQFTSKLKKNVSKILGKMYLIDKKTGKVLMETSVNINKAFNIFRGTEIRPGEKLTYRVDFIYDKRNPDHRLAKELPLDQLEVKFKPIEVVYSDGTIIYYGE